MATLLRLRGVTRTHWGVLIAMKVLYMKMGIHIVGSEMCMLAVLLFLLLLLLLLLPLLT